MTIAGWIAFVVLATLIALGGIAIFVEMDSKHAVWVLLIAIVLIIALFFGFRWYFANTASGQRAMIDQQSELRGGLDRRIVIYTANGEVLAEYEGQIDIEANDGGYIKFDFEGKRYIYYNCFVESIADIGG